MLALSKDARAAVEQLKVEMDLWENTVVTLRTNDKGRALGSQPQLCAATARGGPPPPRAARPRRTSPTRPARSSGRSRWPTPPPATSCSRHRRCSPSSRTSSSGCGRRRRRTRSPASRSRRWSHRQGTGEPPSTELLGAVIVNQEREEALESTKVVEQEYLKAKEEGTRRVAAAKAELMRAEAEKEEATLKASAKAAGEAKDREVERIRTLADLQKKTETEKLAVDRRAAELERQRVFIRSDTGRQRIESYLKPFVTPGYSQPPSRNWTRSTRGGEKKPASLSILRESGALDETLRGYFTLASAANNPGNDRPHWTMEILSSPEGLSNEAIEFLKVAQGLPGSTATGWSRRSCSRSETSVWD